MQYKNFERAEMLHTCIKNIMAKEKELHDALRQPQYYHLVLECCEPGHEPIDFFSDGEEPYIREVATRYVAELEQERHRLIAEFEGME